MLINKSNGTNCKYVCKLYVGALVSEHQTNHSSLTSTKVPGRPEMNVINHNHLFKLSKISQINSLY